MQVTELRTVINLILQQSKYKYSYAFVIYSFEIGKNEKKSEADKLPVSCGTHCRSSTRFNSS